MKKEWQKPELICLSINEDTQNGNPGSNIDGSTMTIDGRSTTVLGS